MIRLIGSILPVPEWTSRLPRERRRPGEAYVETLSESERIDVAGALVPIASPTAPKRSRQFPPAYAIHCWGAGRHNDIASGFGDVLALCWVIESEEMGVTDGSAPTRADEPGDVLLVDQADWHACLPIGFRDVNAESYSSCGHWMALCLTVERRPELLARLLAG